MQASHLIAKPEPFCQALDKAGNEGLSEMAAKNCGSGLTPIVLVLQATEA